MTKDRRWFRPLRVLLGGVRALGRIAAALERIADVAEGHPPTTPLDDAPADPTYSRAYRDDAELLRVDLIERELAPILGRQPTEDEIVAALDGVEWNEGDAAAHLDAVRRRAGLT